MESTIPLPRTVPQRMAWRWLLAGALVLGPAFLSAASLQQFPAQWLPARNAGGTVRILHFGDSHLAAPAAARAYGDFFRRSYGDGGPGLALPWVLGVDGVRAQA
ncbi:MAG TPA: hypothetical protein VN436_07490, partial [Holophaga sp.]|nr:hypothetical protein [Holophaga sp.]